MCHGPAVRNRAGSHGDFGVGSTALAQRCSKRPISYNSATCNVYQERGIRNSLYLCDVVRDVYSHEGDTACVERRSQLSENRRRNVGGGNKQSLLGVS